MKMKLKLQSHGDGPRLASVYGVNWSKKNNLFFYDEFEELECISSWKREITIDLEKNQPCIYACMREGLKVEVELTELISGKHFNPFQKMLFDFSSNTHKKQLFEVLSDFEVQSIEILDLGQYTGCEVIDG